VTDDDALYKYLDTIDSVEVEEWNALIRAEEYSFVDPNPSHFSSAELNAELYMTRDAMEINFRWGSALQDLHRDYPEFAPAPSGEELDALEAGNGSGQERARLTKAASLTEARVANLVSAMQQAMHAPIK
jgi:hypothetical protein